MTIVAHVEFVAGQMNFVGEARYGPNTVIEWRGGKEYLSLRAPVRPIVARRTVELLSEGFI